MRTTENTKISTLTWFNIQSKRQNVKYLTKNFVSNITFISIDRLSLANLVPRAFATVSLIFEFYVSEITDSIRLLNTLNGLVLSFNFVGCFELMKETRQRVPLGDRDKNVHCRAE